MDPFTLYAVTGAVNAGLSYFSAKENTKRANKAKAAKVAAFRLQQRAMQESFLYETLNLKMEAQTAGAARIARSAAGGFTGAGGMASTLNHLDNLASRRDIFLLGKSLDYQLQVIDKEIAGLHFQSPSQAGLDAALESGIDTAFKYVKQEKWPEWKKKAENKLLSKTAAEKKY